MTSNYVKSMEFNNYSVNELEYRKNENFDFASTDKFSVDNRFSSLVLYSKNEDKSNAMINLSAVIGDLESKNTPFQIQINITGAFKLSFNDGDFSDDDKVKNIKGILAANGNAILFPYVRSLVYDMSVKSNIFPAYIFPTINFYEELKHGKSIKFKEVDI